MTSVQRRFKNAHSSVELYHTLEAKKLERKACQKRFAIKNPVTVSQAFSIRFGAQSDRRRESQVKID